MATRRTVHSLSAEKDPNSKDFILPSADEKSNIAPAVPAGVIYKLLAFTFAMIFLPIGTYFASLNVIFGGNSTWAGATAAIVANIVLIGYILVAFNEDQSEAIDAANAKKGL